jgi:1-acyl-sn-glycerol-3-phosphate acyltransferase
MNKRRVIYYKDELRDEFSSAVIEPKMIDGSYDYLRDKPYQQCIGLCLRALARPMAYIYSKVIFGHRIVNREALTRFADRSCFLYGNHTQDIFDALLPSLISYDRDVFVIADPRNVSMPVLGRITPYLGALPLPDDKAARKNFVSAIDSLISRGKMIAIYPEAHIWPFYTGIRPFGDDSFYYPVKYGAPAFCFTNTYQLRPYHSGPMIVTYIDGPFFADLTLPYRQRRAELRNRIYARMCERAQASCVEKIKYVKVDKM